MVLGNSGQALDLFHGQINCWTWRVFEQISEKVSMSVIRPPNR
jgi:hypothetical protein